MSEKLYIIIPAYNESENIRDVIDDWYPVIERYHGDGKSRLIIIDDGSTDNTYGIVTECAKNRSLLQVITKPNSGHGAAILFGYNYALAEKAEYIFQTDSDGQTLSSEFDQFWRLKDQYDMVIGWRRAREDGCSRIFVTKTLKAVIRICFGVKLADANAPFRLMKAETLKKHIGLIPEGFNLSNVILSVVYAKKKCTVKYIPITFRERQGGVNSINMKHILKIGIQALKDFREIAHVLK